MPEWWTYSLSDFLMFSPRTYYRQIELYNLAIWPAQLVGAGIGAAILAIVCRPTALRGRIVAGLLAGCWLWIAWAFHFERYAQISTGAPWFAAAFAVQALLLVGLGVVAGGVELRSARSPGGAIAIVLVMLAIVAYPFLAPLTGRAWTMAESFGVAPDPTAIATAATLALVKGRIRWVFLAIPLAWCLVSAATLGPLDAPEVWAVLVAMAFVLWVATRKS